MAAQRKWPKLGPMEQVRIRHIPTGKYVWRPKGSSSQYRLVDNDCTVWSSFKGPGAFINEQIKRALPADQGGYRYYDKPLGLPEDFVFEIVEFQVVRCINCEDQIQQHKEQLAQEVEDAKYKPIKRAHDIFKPMTKDQIEQLKEKFGSGLRFKEDYTYYVRLHQDDISTFVARIMEALLAGKVDT